MLKTTGSTKSAANLKETEGKIGDDNVVGNWVDGGKATNSTKGKNQAKMTKSKILVKFKNHDFAMSKTEEARSGFFIPEAKLAFTQLRQAFIEATIFHHFNLESHIRIETNASGYTIGNILSQLYSGIRPDGVVTKDNFG